MKAKELIGILELKCNPDEEIEFAICTKEGMVVAIDITDNARDLSKILDMFGGIIPRDRNKEQS